MRSKNMDLCGDASIMGANQQDGKKSLPFDSTYVFFYTYVINTFSAYLFNFSI
ncbi:hypothetical protein HanIR_Chr11g0545441 [Helianthus annuus]|nr:hypothetical protein HanIR_Chr11g0545441 [Helianthus annuus]